MNQEIRKKSLGRGLEDLFQDDTLDYEKVEQKILRETPHDEIVQINIDELRPNPYQPRKIFNKEALEELATSIKEYGVFQPIIVKKSIKGYEIIAGERRVKASKLAGLEKIPAIVRDFTDNEMMEIALLENLQRENLSSIEEAIAYKKLQEALRLTQEELAKKLGKSRSHITNMLGLLTLPVEIQEMVNNKQLTMGHARAISKIESKEQQVALAKQVVSEGISVRGIENLTQFDKTIKKTHRIVRHENTIEYQYIENILCEKLGTRVRLKSDKIEISFTNTKDLNRILEIMNITKE